MIGRLYTWLQRALGRPRPRFDDVLREARFAQEPVSIRVSTLERVLSNPPRTQPPTRGH